MELQHSAEADVRSATLSSACPFCETFQEDIQRLQTAFAEARLAAQRSEVDSEPSSSAARGSENVQQLRAEYDSLQVQYAAHLDSHSKLLQAQKKLAQQSAQQQEEGLGNSGRSGPPLMALAHPTDPDDSLSLDRSSSTLGSLGSPLQPRHLAALPVPHQPSHPSPGRPPLQARRVAELQLQDGEGGVSGEGDGSSSSHSSPARPGGPGERAVTVPPPPFNSGWLRTCALADAKTGRRKQSVEFFALGSTTEQPVPVPTGVVLPPPLSGGDAAWRQGEGPSVYSAVDITDTSAHSHTHAHAHASTPASPGGGSGGQGDLRVGRGGGAGAEGGHGGSSNNKRGSAVASASTVNSGSGTRQLFSYYLHQHQAQAQQQGQGTAGGAAPLSTSMSTLAALTAAAASSFTPLHTYHLSDALKHVRVLTQEQAETDLVCQVSRLLHSHAQAGIAHLPDTIWSPFKHKLEVLLRAAGESADLSYSVWVYSTSSAVSRTKSLLNELLQREALGLEQVLLALTACRAVPLASFSLNHELSIRDVRILHIILRASGVHSTRRARAHTDVLGGLQGGQHAAGSAAAGGHSAPMGGAGGGHAGLGAPLGHALSPNVPSLHLHLSLAPPPSLHDAHASHGEGPGAAIRNWAEAHGMHWPFSWKSGGKSSGSSARSRAGSVGDPSAAGGGGARGGGVAVHVGGINTVHRSNSQQGITADMAPDAQRIVGAEAGTLLYRAVHSDLSPLDSVREILHAGADLGRAWYALAYPLAVQGGAGAGAAGLGGSLASLSPALSGMSGAWFGEPGLGGGGIGAGSLGLGLGTGGSAPVVTRWEDTHILHVASALDHALTRWAGTSLSFLAGSSSSIQRSSSVLAGNASSGAFASGAAAGDVGGGSAPPAPQTLQQAVIALLRIMLKHDPSYLSSEPGLVDAMIGSLLCGVQGVFLTLPPSLHPNGLGSGSGVASPLGMGGGGGSSITSMSSGGSGNGGVSVDTLVEARLAVIRSLLSTVRRRYKRQMLIAQMEREGASPGNAAAPGTGTGSTAAAASGGGGGAFFVSTALLDLARLDREEQAEEEEEEEGDGPGGREDTPGMIGPLANWQKPLHPSEVPTPHAEESPGVAPLAMLSVTKRRGSILAGTGGARHVQQPVHMHMATKQGETGAYAGLGGLPEGPTADFSAHAHTACLCRHHDAHAPLRALLCPPAAVPEHITQRCIDCLLSCGYPIFFHPQLALSVLPSSSSSLSLQSEAGLPQWRLAALDPRCTFLRVGLLGSRQLTAQALCTVPVPVADGLTVTVLELLCHAGNMAGAHMLLRAWRPEHTRALSVTASQQLCDTLSFCVDAVHRALADQRMGAGSRGLYIDWSAVTAAQARGVNLASLQLEAEAGLKLVSALRKMQEEVQAHIEALQRAIEEQGDRV